MLYDRTDRINEEVKRELSEILRRLKDPRIPEFTTVVAVEVTKDLKFAKAYISVMGDEQKRKEAIKGLTAAAGFIRREIGKCVQLRALPEFHFVLDETISYGAHINQILSTIEHPKEEKND